MEALELESRHGLALPRRACFRVVVCARDLLRETKRRYVWSLNTTLGAHKLYISNFIGGEL